MTKVQLNLDNFCPLCYAKDGIMRNVYKPIGSKEDELYCSIHGRVMVEDIDLKRYMEKDIDDSSSVPDNNAIVGKAVVGKAVL